MNSRHEDEAFVVSSLESLLTRVCWEHGGESFRTDRYGSDVSRKGFLEEDILSAKECG